MALGGGVFIDQSKILPGAYINFISLSQVNASLSDRGVAAIALNLDYGPSKELIKLTRKDFVEGLVPILGQSASDEKMKGLRDLFKNVKMAYVYNLQSGGKKAENAFATAKYPGTRGNDFKIVIHKNAKDESAFDVITFVGTEQVDKQTAKTAKDLVNNAYVDFKSEASLAETASTPLAGGENGTANGEAHQDFLNKLEPVPVNAIGCISNEDSVKSVYETYTKRMREEVGKKLQCVLFNQASDYEGVVNLTTPTKEGDTNLVYWVTGIIAGCAINQSNINQIYNGEFTPIVEQTQAELEDDIKTGKFVLHQVGDDIRVLHDNNSLVTFSNMHGEIFRTNQAVRVMDQIANDIANLFNTKYFGIYPNDESGRISLWSDIVRHHERLEALRAIQNFDEKDVIVQKGKNKNTVVVSDKVNLVGTMAQLYMTVVLE